jgi:flagellar protein FliO/FliZ
MFQENRAILLEASIVDQLNSKNIEAETTGRISTSDNVWEFIGLVLLLAVILIATYYTTKWIGKIKFGQLKSNNFQLIDSYNIAPNKMLQIVKVTDKYIVIAVGKDSVQFITELEEEQVKLKKMPSGEKQSFKKLLAMIKDKNKSET